MKSEATISPDDPRLSAYLFGELSIEESLVVEAQLRRSPEAQAELEEFRAMSDLLRDSFAAELTDAAQDQPSLSLLPAPREEGKVIAFAGAGQNRQWRVRRIAAVATLAAAVILGLMVLPKAVTETESDANLAVAEPTGAPREVTAPAAAEVSVPAPSAATPASKVPAFGYRGETEHRDGLHQVSWTGDDRENSLDSRPRSPGSDPTITEVRFLSDDPVDLRGVPLPA